MTDRDNITLPREVVQEAAEALEYAERNHGGVYTQEITALRTALAAEQPSEDIEALRRDAYQGGWLREWLDSNGLLARAIRGESLAGYEHPDIKALRRDAERLADENERLREALEKIADSSMSMHHSAAHMAVRLQTIAREALRREGT